MTSKLGMHEAVLRMHRPSVPPETHNRNTQQIPIDGIFVTPGIQPTQGGYTSYGQCVASDHRSIWLDIPYTSILGHNLPDMHRRPTRRLQAKDPRLVDKYNKISKNAMAQSQQALPKEVQRLVTMCKEGASRIDIMIQHSHILKHSVRIRLEAARKTRHIYSGKWAWSPEWRKLERQVKLWRVAKQRFHRRIRGRYLRRLMKRAGNQDCFQLNEEQTILRHAEAQANLNAFKPKAEDFRNEHLKSLAKEIATRKHTSMEVELKKLTNQESMRRMGAQLRATSKKGKKGLATKTETGPPDDPVMVEDKEGLEFASAGENQSRFTESLKVSEFMTDPILREDIGVLCEGPAVDPILNGTYQPPSHLSWPSTKVLEFMEMPPVIQRNPMGQPKLSLEAHKQGWRKAKEHTSSDPRNPDFSHYISASYDDILADMDRLLDKRD